MKDIIYRDDAIKCCRNEWEEEVEERLRLLPTADVREVVHGEWIETDQDTFIECSACHSSWDTCENESYLDFKYCPWCGARMKFEWSGDDE